LNFNEFAGYSQRRKVAELGEVAEHIEENSMPLRSYKLIHRDARLKEDEKSRLISWARSSADTLSARQE
jgi:Haem-binding domain